MDKKLQRIKYVKMILEGMPIKASIDGKPVQAEILDSPVTQNKPSATATAKSQSTALATIKPNTTSTSSPTTALATTKLPQATTVPNKKLKKSKKSTGSSTNVGGSFNAAGAGRDQYGTQVGRGNTNTGTMGQRIGSMKDSSQVTGAVSGKNNTVAGRDVVTNTNIFQGGGGQEREEPDKFLNPFGKGGKSNLSSQLTSVTMSNKPIGMLRETKRIKTAKYLFERVRNARRYSR